VIGEEIAPDTEPLVRHCEVLSKEPREETEQCSVGIRHHDRVDRLRAFRPEEHAADRVQCLALPRSHASFLLILRSTATEGRCAGSGPRSQGFALIRRELDVADPDADR
jgi:hypothetical protein